MEEGVEALVGGELGGHGQHQIRVHDGQNREGVLVAAAHLLVGLVVGDDGPGVQLGAGAGGGGNGHDGQGLVFHPLAAAGAAVDVVPVVALVGGHHGDGLGRVNAAAAAQAQDKITAVLPGAGRAVHHVGNDGVGQDLVKNGVLHAGLGQLVLDGVQVAVGPGGLAAGNDDEGLLAGQALLVQLLDSPLAKDKVSGNMEGKAHDNSLLSGFDRRSKNAILGVYCSTDCRQRQSQPPPFPPSSGPVPNGYLLRTGDPAAALEGIELMFYNGGRTAIGERGDKGRKPFLLR